MALSSIAIESALSVNTDQVWLLLLEMQHPDIEELDNTFYLVNNKTFVKSNNRKYLPYPFSIVLADSDPETLPKVKLTIDNVDQQIIQSVRAMAGSPSIVIKLVLASDPDDVQFEISGLVLREVPFDQFTITGTLYTDDLLNSRHPADTISLAAGYLGAFK